MKTVIEMAREAGFDPHDMSADFTCNLKDIERFAELVRADERNRVWTQDHWTEYEHAIAAAEREACAKVCEAEGLLWGNRYAAAIRARGNT